MRPDPPPPRGPRPWWLLPVAVALLAAPTGTVLGVAVGAVAVRLALAGWRRERGRRRLEATRAAAASTGPATPAVVLGADPSGARVALSDEALAAHGLILGASGAGKTTTLLTILVAQIRRGRPVVAIDLKGSPAFAARLCDAAEAAGRTCRVWTLDGPERWNPLGVGNPTELKDKLIATERFTEPHYQRAAERYVQTALQVAAEVDADTPLTLARVVELLEPARLGALARRIAGDRGARVADYLTALTPDQLSAVRGLGSRLAVISESHTGAFLSPAPGEAGIDLRAALAGSEVVVFSLNSSTYGRLAGQVGTLAIQDLVTAAGGRLTERTGGLATVGIDEFSALGADNVVALIARGREAGIGIVLATQELADLDRAARGLRDQVLGNSAVKIAHRQDVPASAEAVARMTGTVRVWERSYGLRRSGNVDRGQGSLRLVDRHVVDAERVRTLETGEAVVIVKTPQASTRLTRVIGALDRGGAGR